MNTATSFRYEQPERLDKAFQELFNLVYTLRVNHIRNVPQVDQKADQVRIDTYLNKLILDKDSKLKAQ